MVLARDLIEPVAQRAKEIFVGRDDGAIKVEGNDCLNAGDRLNLGGMIGGLLPLRRYVGRELDDFDRLAAAIQDRIVAGLYPHLASTLAKPLEGRGLIIALGQLGPEGLVVGTGDIDRITEHGMVLALHFVQRISHGCQKILVRGEHRAVQLELDHGLAPHDRVNLALIVSIAGTKKQSAHFRPLFRPLLWPILQKVA